MSLNFANCTTQTYQKSWVDVGVTNVECPYTLQTVQCRHIIIHGWALALQASSVLKLYRLYNEDISEFMGGHWRYKLLVSLYDCAMQTYQNSRVDVGVTNLQCLQTLQTVQCRHIRIDGWTLALQTSSVLKLYRLHNADISIFIGGHP